MIAAISFESFNIIKKLPGMHFEKGKEMFGNVLSFTLHFVNFPELSEVGATSNIVFHWNFSDSGVNQRTNNQNFRIVPDRVVQLPKSL